MLHLFQFSGEDGVLNAVAVHSQGTQPVRQQAVGLVGDGQTWLGGGFGKEIGGQHPTGIRCRTGHRPTPRHRQDDGLNGFAHVSTRLPVKVLPPTVPVNPVWEAFLGRVGLPGVRPEGGEWREWGGARAWQVRHAASQPGHAHA